ncbi:MAG: aldo/keto reductase [Holophaga sp.]|jgi:aryl-alcohol dehydrogenase-like predicted oxidoreductase
MDKRKLGNSDMMITPLGVGAWAMGGGGWAFGWGAQDDRQSAAAIRAALEAGWNWIDTAAVYGLGHSEEVVARALEEVSGRPYVFTKCALVWDTAGKISGRLKRESVRRECEASLRRLKVDRIDLYQIHWPDPAEDIEEGWEALAALRAEGKLRWAGVSNFNVPQLERISPKAPVTSLQPPYSIISPEVEQEILPHCLAQNIGVIVYSPMKSGLLTGRMTAERVRALPEDDFRKRAAAFQEPRLSRNLAVAELLREIGAPHGRTPGEVAIAWCLRQPAVTGAIVGVRSPDQVRGLTGAATFRLSAEEVERIAKFMAEHPA